MFSTSPIGVQAIDEKAELSLQLNGKELHKVKVKKVKKSGSDWQEISAAEELDAGEYSLKLISKKGRVRLNWVADGNHDFRTKVRTFRKKCGC